ncbi:hypothetical protein [Saccharopolyspora sp. ASAGF58]|nr:hypothetical protein [Saccharopolyspora sp. ASAGF58]
MTGAVRATGKPIWAVRTGIEVIVLAVGWVLARNRTGSPRGAHAGMTVT